MRFKIDWMDVEWVDLRKPLYSGLAARLFLSTILQPIPHIADINGQAEYWKTNYTDGSSGTEKDFVDTVEALKREGNFIS